MISKEEQFRPPNYVTKEGKPYLIRCYDCGYENWCMAIAKGYCAICGWGVREKKDE